MRAKIKNYFLIFVILQIIVSPFTALGLDPADHSNDFKGIEKTIGNVNCSLDVSCWVKKGMAWAGYIILSVINIFLWLSVQVFNLSADLSLDYAAYSKNTAVAVYNGWRITRDFMNIFFIFVILFIAISIILQLQTYGSQKVLFMLIGVAIFINFSFFITQQIIVASNSMALFFFGPVKNTTILSSDILTALNPTQVLTGYKIDPKYLDESIKKDFSTNKQKLCEKSADDSKVMEVGGYKAWKNMVDTCMKQFKIDSPAIKEAEERILTDENNSWITIIATIVGGIAIILTAAFIFAAFAIMFLFRTAVLWILMILSPIAFMSFALPGGKGYWEKWRKTLLDQAFFAPVAMFMLFIVIKIIVLKDPATGLTFLQTYVLRGNTTTIGQSFIFNFYLVAQYIILLMLLGLSLYVAKNMGGHGASIAIKYGTTAANWVKGQAGKAGASPLRAARREMAEGARKVAEGEGGFLRHIPGAKATARAIIGSERQKIAGFEKQWSNLPAAEIAADLKSSKPMSRERLMGELGALTKQGRLDLVGSDRLKQIHGYMSGLGMDTKEIETYMPSLAKDSRTREKAVQNQKSDKVGFILKNSGEFARKTSAAGTLVPNDNQEFFEKYWGDSHLEEAGRAAHTDPVAAKSLKEFFDAMVHEYAPGKTGSAVKMDDIISGLEAKGNFKIAKALKTEEGEKIFKNNASGGTDFVTGSQVTEQKTKQTLQFKDSRVADIIRVGIPAGASPEDKKKTIDTINIADNKRLITLLEELSSIERRELRAMLKTQDPKLDQRVGMVEKERNKQVLQLEDQEIADRVKKVKTGSSQSEREDITNLMNSADDKKLSAILNKMADKKERQETKDAVNTVDPKLDQRIVKLMPELENIKADQIKIFNQMKQEDVQNFDYEGLKTRSSAAGININNILDSMIKGFNPAHLKTLAERGDNMMKEIMNKLTDGGTKTNVLDVAIKLEEPTGLNRKDLANYLISAPAVAGLLGLET